MLGTTIDEAFDIPTEATQHLALRTQQIVALESDVCSTVDPLGGSYFVEAMTDAIEAAARVEFAGVGGSAGIVDAIEAGVPQAALAERAFSLASEIASGIRPVVGVNVYVDGDSRTRELQIHHADPSVEASRITAVSILRAERDAATVERALDAVRVAASGTESVMPSIIAAVEAYATVGEISSALEDVLGTYREPTAL
jgi:methylmalonyl-CoA mutase N-terminal domain/subunit